MASEIYAALTYRVAEDNLTITAEIPGASLDMTGTEMTGNIQEIGTVAEAIALGDLASAGALVAHNLDATNFVEIDSANTFDKFPQKLLPGKWCVLRPQTVTIYAKADTAACRLKIVAHEL